MKKTSVLQNKINNLIDSNPAHVLNYELDGDLSAEREIQLAITEKTEDRSPCLLVDANFCTRGMRKDIIEVTDNHLSPYRMTMNDLLEQVEQEITQDFESKYTERQQKNEKNRIDKINAIKDKYTAEYDHSFAKSSAEEAELRYDEMNKNENGRPPNHMRSWVYWPIMLLIGLLESFVNYQTFISQYASLALAVSATILIAFCLAVSSHRIGKIFKQSLALFGPDIERRKKWYEVWNALFYLLLVVVAIVVVTVLRHYALMNELADQAGSLLLLEEDVATTPSMEVIFSFIGLNTIALGVGMAVSMLAHDKKPDYSEAMIIMLKTRKTILKLDSKMNKEIAQVQALFDKSEEENKNVRQAEKNKMLLNKQERERLCHHRNRVLTEVEEKERRVLEEYQNNLVQHAQKSNANLVFQTHSGNRLSIEEYASLGSLNQEAVNRNPPSRYLQSV